MGVILHVLCILLPQKLVPSVLESNTVLTVCNACEKDYVEIQKIGVHF